MEEAAQLFVEVVAVDVALRQFGDDRLHRILELATALEILFDFWVRQVCSRCECVLDGQWVPVSQAAPPPPHFCQTGNLTVATGPNCRSQLDWQQAWIGSKLGCVTVVKPSGEWQKG